MKCFHQKLLILALLGGGAVAPCEVQAQCKQRLDFNAPGSGWTIVARDEFDDSRGTGVPDPTYWQITTQGNNNPLAGVGCEMYDASMVTVSGGAAHLRASRLRDALGNPTSVQDNTGATPRQVLYRSGRLSSTPGGNFNIPSFGAYEARLKLPANGEDAWPTFWLWGVNTEIDMLDGARVSNWPGSSNPGLLTNVLDWRGRDAQGKPFVQAHCSRRSRLWSAPWYANATLLSAQYNTYTMVWTPDRVTFFLNGREIHTVLGSSVQTVQQYSTLFINLQISGWTTSTDDFQLDVDYVRLLRPTCMLNGGCSDSYVMGPETYKSTYEAINHDISQPVPFATIDSSNGYVYNKDPSSNPTWPRVSAQPGSIALVRKPSGEATTQVFYRSTDNHLYLASNASASDWTVATLPYASGYDVAGDVTYNSRFNLAVYKGTDGYLQGYYRDGSGDWQHTWLTGSAGPGNILVDTLAGAISHRDADGVIAYRGRNRKINYFTVNPTYYANTSTNAYSYTTTLTTTDGRAANVAGDVVCDQYTRNILYRGQDNRLQVYYWDGKRFNHSWIDDYWNITDNLMAAKPNTLVTNPNGSFYVGQDDKVHCFVYKGSINRFVPSVLPNQAYVYGQTGYYMADKVKGSLAGNPDGTHLFYQGYNGRLQNLYLDGGQWQHAWFDDYWDTEEFSSFNMNQGAGLASVITDNNRVFYCDAYNHLRYFAWEPCEVTECNTGLGTLHRLIALSTTLLAATSATEDLTVAPNPTSDQVTSPSYSPLHYVPSHSPIP